MLVLGLMGGHSALPAAARDQKKSQEAGLGRILIPIDFRVKGREGKELIHTGSVPGPIASSDSRTAGQV